jgi:hypothetical protein
LFYDYTQNATVHGIKYITEKDTYSFRKWVAIAILHYPPFCFLLYWCCMSTPPADYKNMCVFCRS